MVNYKPILCTFLLVIYILVLFFEFNLANEDVKLNPFVFHDEDFTTLLNSQEGKMNLLMKFNERSQLFKGIENIRMWNFEANPHTFVTPTYWDSDILFFVGHGRGTITLVFEDGIQNYNIEKGHLMTITAGTVFYIINRDDQEKLMLYGFIMPIANPGNFAPFFGIASQSTESVYSAFSDEVLGTFFNTSSDKVRNLFSGQRKEVILKASKDQIASLIAEEDVNLPHGSSYCLKEYGPCQIFNHNTENTEFGMIFMVFQTDYLKLQDLNMYISFSVTSQGCMNSPLYSTRVTKVIMVINGSGWFEVAVPYREEGSSVLRYKKISAELKQGMVFVVPPGYPLVLVASETEKLETLNLEFFGKGNNKHLLGGRNNIYKFLPKEVKELTFATSAEDVDEVLNSQHLDFFMKGPSQLQRQGTSAF